MNTKTASVDTEIVPFDTARSIVANAIGVLGCEWIPLSDALGLGSNVLLR